MNFKSWFEAVNVMGAATDHIVWRKSTMGSYVYAFYIDNNKYTVDMRRTSIYVGNEEVPGSYEIYFSGPDSYGLTGTAGGSAAKVYTQVLLSIKNFFETHEVNGFEVSAMEPEMRPLYEKFYRNFLKHYFLRISRNEYVRKSFLKAIWPSLDNKKDVAANALFANRTIRQDIKSIRKNKIDTRNKERGI